MAYSKQKQNKLMTSLINIGSLAGNNDIGVANGIKGLEMGLEQKKCNEEAKAVRDGLFKVVIIGTFASGKSTVINALVGSKILPEAALPSTAILTFIQYGKEEDGALVYMADELQKDGTVKTGECIHMSVEDFQNEYKYTIEDQKEFNETGTVERFAKVKYSVMYCSKPLMEGGVSIIDSPGLEDKKVATDLAMKIAQEAQAIIYVVTERGFTSPDKDYIYSAFRNCPNNVFFLLNKFDLVQKEERPVALEKLKLDLQPVFTDSEGKFNEELYGERVFGISAIRALDARRGLTYNRNLEEEIHLSDEECEKMYKLSQFEKFEEHLERFLTTDEKCLAQYKKCFSQMASTYRNARVQIDDYISAYESEIQMDDERKAECATIIDDIRKSIKLTETTFDNCSLRIQNKIAAVLDGCSASIDKSWEQDMVDLAQKLDVSTLEYLWIGLKQMNPVSSRESKQKSMEEFSGQFITVVCDYFAEKVNNYLEVNKPVIYDEVDECQRILNISLDNTESLFEDLSKKITDGKDISISDSDKNWLQIMISTALGDYSAAIRGAADGKSTWVEFFKKLIFNCVWQAVLLSLVDGGLGVLLAILIEYMQGKSNKNDTVKKILSKSKDDIVRNIRQQSLKIRNTINKEIAVEIEKKKIEKSEDMNQKLCDEQKKMDAIEAAFSNHNFNLEAEKSRFRTILSSIYSEAKEAYSVVFEKELSLQKFETY